MIKPTSNQLWIAGSQFQHILGTPLRPKHDTPLFLWSNAALPPIAVESSHCDTDACACVRNHVRPQNYHVIVNKETMEHHHYLCASQL